MITHASLSDVDEFNFEDQSYTLLRKCNYADTIYGTWFNNMIVKRVAKVDPKSFEAVMLYPLSLFAWAIDWYSVMTTIMEISYSSEIFLDRMDYYNSGKLAGKFIKLIYQIHEKNLFEGKLNRELL